jgi:predicted amidohydrolase
MNTDKTLTIAHWVANYGTVVKSAQEWCAVLESQLDRAKAEGADVLLIPEYISESWLHYAPADLPPTDEVKWMAGQSLIVQPVLQDLVKKTGVALVAGSMPWPHESGQGFTNRAWFLFPDRNSAFHDKLVMTPFEKDPASWELEVGKVVKIIEWRGFRLAILICLDIEMPILSCKMSTLDIDLIFVPSQTEKPSGYHRVFGCAKARAVEMLTALAVVGCVGSPTLAGKKRNTYNSGASLYLPCEEVFGYTGIWAEIPVTPGKDLPGEMLISRDVPLGKIRAIRHGKPEVWPGPWNADGVKITEAA